MQRTRKQSIPGNRRWVVWLVAPVSRWLGDGLSLLGRQQYIL